MRRLPVAKDGLMNPMGMSISCIGIYGMGQRLFNASPVSTAWPLGNLSLFIPFRIGCPVVVVNLGVQNGTTVSGNIDVGIYSVDGVRLVSSGSTAQAGTSNTQVFNTADILIGPGVFYFGLALDNTTGTTRVFATYNVAFGQCIGMAEMTSAFPLPATATFASYTRNYVPMCLAGTHPGGVL